MQIKAVFAVVVYLGLLLVPNGSAQQSLRPALGTDPLEEPMQASEQERVAKHKQTILSQLKHKKVTYRGDKPGEIRIRWEWYDKAVNNYLFEKRALLRELSAQEKYVLRARWVYKDMKVTFQELFQLGPEDDDKLLPILSHSGLLGMSPSATFEGLTLLGKHGEVKGPVIRKNRKRSSLFGLEFFVLQLEYKNRKGKVVTAKGRSYDAFTIRWKDVKDRVADDMSEAKALEDLRLERDALATEPEP